MKGRFKPGNKAAEKWTSQEAASVLQGILKHLWQNETTGEQGENPVRANTIKFRKEACMLVNLTDRQWQHLKRKFTTEASPYFNDTVADLVQKIEDTCECRLIYSGTAMDIFILKSHYGFTDERTQRINDLSVSKQAAIVAPVIQIIEQN